jgi:hypothetical protein
MQSLNRGPIGRNGFGWIGAALGAGLWKLSCGRDQLRKEGRDALNRPMWVVIVLLDSKRDELAA